MKVVQGHNPAVSLKTRQWLTRCAAKGVLLTPSAAQPIFDLLRSSAENHPGGLFYVVGTEIGIPHHQAMVVGSIVEMLFGCINALDDLQDGDLEANAININSCLHLLMLSIGRIQAEISSDLHISTDLSGLLVGQFGDLQLRHDRDFSFESYMEISRAIAVDQFKLYGKVVLESAPPSFDATNRHRLICNCGDLGLLLQVVNDIRQCDARYIHSSPYDIQNVVKQTPTDASLYPSATLLRLVVQLLAML